ncbi:MAG: deoxyribodipyrimidine photo-lyase [Alphaproteobacteria bacterium]|nr:deoxyribodipyrimidine photo-lyase [Alphaproteobacteria bacterium]
MTSSTKTAQDKPLSIVWLRRDLRLYDHAAFAAALAGKGSIQPVFVFDTDILEAFPQKDDRRLTFIAEALVRMDAELGKAGGKLLVLHGKAQELLPKLAKESGAAAVYCSADYEPATRERDKAVAKDLEKLGVAFHAVCDHLIHPPTEVLKADGKPYLVFTPYSKAWRAKLNNTSFDEKPVKLNGRLADGDFPKSISLDKGAEAVLKQIGYTHNPHDWWKVEEGESRLKAFIGKAVSGYKDTRDFMANEKGTSHISPYLRFGIVSIRHCARLAVEQKTHDTWMNELIWREFYAMVLYHFPESQNLELIEKYRGLDWSQNKVHWKAFVECRTGYPIVDAAMRQLHETGWMHNRSRMIVASFLTKDLLQDWRLGDAHFAQWLMDYDMASNVGGWQWAASTGTDAAPYFRIFNPITQSKRFDPEGTYIRRWLPELKLLSDKEIHFPSAEARKKLGYAEPVVDHDDSRKRALAMYKHAGEEL